MDNITPSAYRAKVTTGVSLLIAALSAKGESLIHNIEQIDRGYEGVEWQLL